VIPDNSAQKLCGVLKNTAYLMFAEAARPVLSFLLILVISRSLGRGGMGAYTIILSFTALFESIATAGLSPLIVRGIAADRSMLRFYVSGSVGVALLASAIVLPVLLWSLRALNYPAEIASGIKLLSYTIVLTTVQQYLIAVCEGLQNMKLRAIVSTLDTVGRLAIGVFMIRQGYGVVGIVQGMVITRLVTTVIAIVFLANYATIRFDYRLMMRHSYGLLRASLPFLLMTIASTVFWSINTLMLSKLTTVEDVGIYNAAYRIVDILKTVLGSYLIALLPMLSASFSRSLHEMQRDCEVSLKYLALVTLPIAAGGSVLSARLIRLVYGPRFDPAVPILQILIWTVCVFCLVLVFARVLIASHHQLLDLYCNIAALVVNIGIGWLLIRMYGALGAAIATLVSLTLFGALEYLLVTRRLFPIAIFTPLVQAAFASAIMAAVVFSIGTLPLPVVIPVGALVYACVLAGLKPFTNAELGALRELGETAMGRMLRLWRREAVRATD
jgi:O-antigen/teichoic acid export membrane protein